MFSNPVFWGTFDATSAGERGCCRHPFPPFTTARTRAPPPRASPCKPSVHPCGLSHLSGRCQYKRQHCRASGQPHRSAFPPEGPLRRASTLHPKRRNLLVTARPRQNDDALLGLGHRDDGVRGVDSDERRASEGALNSPRTQPQR